jgi:hypothetical protein
MMNEHGLAPSDAVRRVYYRTFGADARPAKILRKHGVQGFKSKILPQIETIFEGLDLLNDPDALGVVISVYEAFSAGYLKSLRSGEGRERISKPITSVAKTALGVPPKFLRVLLSRLPLVGRVAEQGDLVYDDAEYYIEKRAKKIAGKLPGGIARILSGASSSGLDLRFDPELFVAGAEAITAHLKRFGPAPNPKVEQSPNYSEMVDELFS